MENPEDDEDGEDDLEESKSGPSKKKNQSYFWGHEEKVEFVKLLHTYGKRWINISENLSRQNRDQQQCRSHGQKYLQSLAKLKQAAEVQLKNKKAPGNPQLLDEVKRYEEYQFKLAQSIVGKPESEVGRYNLKPHFIPQYLIDRASTPIIKDLPIETILGQIVACIGSELEYYDNNKSGNPDFVATVRVSRPKRQTSK